MKCSTVEKWIYLLDELEEKDRVSVNRHIASCVACQKVYQRVRNEKDILKRTLVATHNVPNQARLTSSIMAAINREGRERSSVFDLAVGYLLSKSLPYGLATLSLFLGLFFFTEFNRSTPLQSTASHAQPGQSGIALNSTLFYQEFNRMKQSGIRTKPLSIYQCVYACQHLGADLCFTCRAKFAKLNKTI